MNSGKNFCPAWSDYGILQWRIQELWKGWAGNPNSSILRPKIGQNRQKQQKKIAEKRGGGAAADSAPSWIRHCPMSCS